MVEGSVAGGSAAGGGAITIVLLTSSPDYSGTRPTKDQFHQQ